MSNKSFKASWLRTALKFLIVFITLYGSLSFSPAKAQTIYLIVFANTNDPSAVLRKGMAETRDNIEAEITEVANVLGLQYKKAVLSGDDSNLAYLHNILSSHPKRYKLQQSQLIIVGFWPQTLL